MNDEYECEWCGSVQNYKISLEKGCCTRCGAPLKVHDSTLDWKVVSMSMTMGMSTGSTYYSVDTGDAEDEDVYG